MQLYITPPSLEDVFVVFLADISLIVINQAHFSANVRPVQRCRDKNPWSPVFVFFLSRSLCGALIRIATCSRGSGRGVYRQPVGGIEQDGGSPRPRQGEGCLEST